MDKNRIIRVPRHGKYGPSDPSYSLLSATQTGTYPLHLRLLGTEGTEAFVATLTPSAASKLKTSAFEGSTDDWEALLRHTLSPNSLLDYAKLAEDEKEHATILKTARLFFEPQQRGKTSILTLKWLETDETGNDTGRVFGSLPLIASEDEEITLYDWLGSSTEYQDKHTSSLKNEISKRNATIKDLEEKLQQLVETKKAHENQLLGKFCLLLNEKKSKIRELQMVIANGSGKSFTSHFLFLSL
jgi:hypothetical protein